MPDDADEYREQGEVDDTGTVVNNDWEGGL